MGWVDQQTNSISAALGTDGSGGGIAGDLAKFNKDVSMGVSDLGKDIAASPELQMIISAAAAYFGVPPALTASIMGVNQTAQKGDITAGIKSGLGSYAVGSMTNSFLTPDAALGSAPGASAGTTAEASAGATAEATAGTAEAASAGTQSSGMVDVIKETAGESKATAGLTDLLGGDPAATTATEAAAEAAASTGTAAEAATGATAAGNPAPGLIEQAMTKGGQLVDKAVAFADKHPVAALQAGQLVLGTVGGMYTASENKERAKEDRDAQREMLNSRIQAEKDAQDRYNNSFSLNNYTAGNRATRPLRRLDGSNVFVNGKMTTGGLQ